jgi:hypothetical protein
LLSVHRVPRCATKSLSIEQHPAPSRADRRARLQTPGFNLTRHLGAFAFLAAAALVLAVWLARAARPSDLWIVPAYLVAANVAEYLMHRFLMHRPLWPRTLYRNHTLGHHRAFHHDSMEIGAWRELDLVMMPWFSLLLFFAGMAPLVATIAWTLGRGAAGLLLLTAVLSFVLYEGMHALYHFPSRVLRRLGLLDNAVFVFLCDHHRHHHRLVRMRWTNFNISMPLSDQVFGSLETEAKWRQERDRRLQASAAAQDTASTDLQPSSRRAAR